MFPVRKLLRRFSQYQELPRQELEKKIILASLLHVDKTGFSDEALSRACDDLNLSSASNRIVEEGPIAIVYHILEESQTQFEREFLKKHGEISFGEKNVRERE